MEERGKEFGDDVAVGWIDAQQHPDIVQQFQPRGLPLTLLFVNHKPTPHAEGLLSAEQLDQFLQPAYDFLDAQSSDRIIRQGRNLLTLSKWGTVE